MKVRPVLTALVCALGVSLAPGLGATASPTVTAAAPVPQAPTIQDGDLDFTVERLAGSDRYATATAISREFTAAGVPVGGHSAEMRC